MVSWRCIRGLEATCLFVLLGILIVCPGVSDLASAVRL